MKCIQIEELLPLFVGDDLATRDSLAVRAHLEDCAACSAIESGYRRTMLMIAGYETPKFADAVYAGIRRRVLADIAADRKPSIYTTLTAILRPRYRWAAACLVLLVAATFALQRLTTREPAVVALDSPSKNSAGLVTPSPAVLPDDVASVVAPNEKTAVKSVNARVRGSIVPRVPMPGIAPRIPTKYRRPSDENVAANSTNYVDAVQPVLRVEMQTKDPNIRIIWFSKHPN